MKRTVVLVALAMAMTAVVFGGGKSDTSQTNPEIEKVLTHDELVAAAKAEGKVVVYSITSRIANAAVEFEKLYGIKVEYSNLKDGELIEKVTKEVGGGIEGADFVISQDSGRIYGQLIAPGYLVNYVPESMKSIIPQEYQNPLTFQLINKVFIFNSERTQTPVMKNIWEVTEPKWRGLVQFKDPNTEGVNMNFLTMITSPEWSAKIDKAYQDLYGKKLVLTTPNAGYEWIKQFFGNGLVLGNSDTTISENIGIKGQPQTTMGLFVYSKTRFDANKNLALMPMTEIEPFSGFMYPAFLHLTRNAKHPNAAKLFIEFLLTPEGYAPWGKDVGAYSTNPNIPVNAGDHPVSFWESRLVLEDPQYLFENRAEVEEFVNNIAYKK
ncbi:ABC transporter substrate-binding protein [Breznakiella homolactica]|uniref:ABC transporter substrate-binding protein n=1 Tax=Breznakiella homolactica TaxID=2798577 RepID=A0A7T7XLR8_9SPIR|nr:ABC transporter substrate-binding protein [Breznakiella homolactica]QQO08636.1 ABC transporter substrate-binding protein [Breznakiella homolactica]